MNNDMFHINEDTCTDIVTGLLPASDVARVLDHVRDCADCEAMLRAHVTDFESFRASAHAAAPAAERQARLTAATETVRAPGGGFNWRAVAQPLGIAAAAVFVIAVVLPILRTSPPPPTYWIPSDREFVEVRSPGHTADEAFYSGVRAYRARDIDGAIELLSGADVSGSYETLRVVYLASALTLVGAHEDALSVIDALSLARVPEPWRSEARWIQYIALVGVGETGRAGDLLLELSQLEGAIGQLARDRLESTQ